MEQKKPPSTDVENWIKSQARIEKAVDVSIVIPAYNEQWRLPPTLIDMIDYFDFKRCSYEIIVVDDGSKDSTSEIARKFERIRPNVKLIRVPENHGKGHALRVGVLNSNGRRVLLADADGATPIEEYSRLSEALDKGADIAIGSRAKYSKDTKVRTRWYRKIIGRTFNTIVNLVLLPDVDDTQCGFKMLTGPSAKFVFELQKSDGFSFDVEILYLARKAGLKTSEVAINWTNVPGSKVNLVLDSMKMFRDTLLFRFKHRSVSPATLEAFLARNKEENA